MASNSHSPTNGQGIFQKKKPAYKAAMVMDTQPAMVGPQSSQGKYQGIFGSKVQQQTGGLAQKFSNTSIGSPEKSQINEALNYGKNSKNFVQQQVTQQIGIVEPNSVEKAQMDPLLGPYNEYTSWVSKTTPVELYAALQDILKNQKEVDLDWKERSFKVLGRKFLNHACSEFQVHMFDKGNSETLVEFQKRSGDCWVFHNIFEHVINEMNRRNMVFETKCYLEPLDDDEPAMNDDEPPQEVYRDPPPKQVFRSVQPEVFLNEQKMQDSGEAGEEEFDERPSDIVSSTQESTGFGESDDDFLDMEPDAFLSPSSTKHAVDFGRSPDFAKDVLDMVKNGYHEARQHSAVTIAQACATEQGRTAFKTADPKVVNTFVTIAHQSFDAQVTRALTDAALSFVTNDIQMRDQVEKNVVEEILLRWMPQNARKLKLIPSKEIVGRTEDILKIQSGL